MELDTSEGQAESAPDTGQAESAPESTAEQSAAPDQTTATDLGNGESFFDPKDIIGTDLEPAYKQMQGQFTKKMQGFTEQQQKIDAFDAFQRDPRGSMEQLARQYGYNFVQSDPGNKGEEDWQPKTWDDVMDRAKNLVRDEIREEFTPLTNEVKDLKRQSIESYFDTNHKDWRAYEQQMVSTLDKYPAMANDPDMLYRMSVPAEILEARATKQALAKLKGEGESSVVSGSKTTSAKTSSRPAGPISLDDAWKIARSEMKSRGMTAPLED